MISISDSDITASGGFLAALADKSCEYIRGVLDDGRKPIPDNQVEDLDRIIVHADPHLDEYFAQLLFRACLPPDKSRCEFLEQSVFAEFNDLGCQHLWPSAAVLGIGSTVAPDASPLFLFDEHVAGHAKIAASCSQIVADLLLASTPDSIATLLAEVNIIDGFGGGHEQNLNNLIKILHEVHFTFDANAPPANRVRDRLTPEWKRAIVDACLTAIIKCLEDGIDLVSDPSQKRSSLNDSLDNYINHSPHSNHPRFDEAKQRIKSVFGDQFKVFQHAVLRDRHGHLKDTHGNPVPQLLVLSRVVFACEHCWGAKVRDIIATHFWEEEFQKQLNFYPVREAVQTLFAQKKDRLVTPVGVFTRAELPPIEAQARVAVRGRKEIRKMKCPVWIITVTPAQGVFRPNQGVSNFINNNNYGCGLILVRDTTLGTSALMKGEAIPADKWTALVAEIKSREDECWKVVEDPDGGIAPFLVNGNRAHQYVRRSNMDGVALSQLVTRTFY